MLTVVSAIIYAAVVLIAVLLIVLVLVQPSKGGGFGSAFGGVGESVFGAQAMGQLSKLTIVLLTLFFVLTLALAVLTGHKAAANKSLLAKEVPAAEAPAKPEVNAPAALGTGATEAAKEVSDEGIVLLENNGILPLGRKVFGLSEEASYYLRNADMKFGKIKDENNKKQELTDSNYSIYIKSSNRKVRKRAFNEMFKTYESLINTYAALLSGTVEVNNESARLRNYNSALEASLYNDDIDAQLYDKLIEDVHKGLPFLFKYYKLKKKVLGVDELHIYDLYAEMVKSSDKKYEYEDAKKIIRNALSVFGDEYISVIDKAFNENWIDVFENKGKKSGAYSWGSYTTAPYILTNYSYDYNGVSTLAHELGHSVHSYFSNKNNPYHMSSYPIFLAEIASTVNELLLAYYILDNTDDENEKKYIISNMLELYRATIYRQTMFAEFEKDIHNQNMNGVTLTSETMNEIYFDKIKTYFAKNIKIDSKIKYEWARIPHFYDSFYVYKYATGLGIASYIVKRIRSNDEDFKNKYINLLKSGGRDYPLVLLKECGIDILNDDIVYEALESFNELIDKFE